MAAITLGTVAAVVGIGSAVAGATANFFGASQANEAQQQMIAIQQRQEAERKKAMELDARRRTLETIRNQQRARALATSTANAQGALFGSGLQGGFGQISGQTGDNLLGIFGNLEVGRNLFRLNQQMGLAQSSYANAQTLSSIGSGLSSLGGAILGNIGTISSIGKGFGSGANSIGAGQGYGSWVKSVGSNGIY